MKAVAFFSPSPYSESLFFRTFFKRVVFLCDHVIGVVNEVPAGDLKTYASTRKDERTFISNIFVLKVCFVVVQAIANGEIGRSERVFELKRFSDLQTIVDELQLSIFGILEGR